MAHKTGNEETEFKVAPPCINSRDATKTPPPPSDSPHPQLTSSSPSPPSISSPVLTSSSMTSSSSRSASLLVKVADPGKEKRSLMEDEAEVSLRMPMKRKVNRCSGCSKKVGLTGFTCRCGQLFCSDHRYSDRHDCTYDYKSAGREAIARENPVVKAAKIVKI